MNASSTIGLKSDLTAQVAALQPARSLIFLNGFAILSVVINHAAGWGYTAMFWWADAYRTVSVPTYDQIGSFSYYFIMFFKQLTVFSVPAFLFITGFFLAYTNRGSQEMLDVKVIKNRILALIIPYLVWSLVVLIGDLLQARTYTPQEYILKLLTGSATPAYFYIPLVIQFWLVSPLVIRYAKQAWRPLLLAAGLVELGRVILNYSLAPGGGLVYPGWLFPNMFFYFTFGVILGFHQMEILETLYKYRSAILAALVLSTGLTLVETEVIFRVSGVSWQGTLITLSQNLYALVFLLWFLTAGFAVLRKWKLLHFLGVNSFGIYLIHPMLLEFLSRVIRRVFPQLLSVQPVFFLLLIVIASGGALLIMRVFSRPPLRKYYRLVFG